MQAHFAQTQPNDLVLASKPEQEAWKTQAEPVQQEMRRLQGQLRRAADGDKAKIEMQIEALDDKMPAPLASIYAVADEPQKASPIKILFHGDYLNPVATVGVRPLGIILPEGTPEAELTTPRPRLKLAEWMTEPTNPFDCPRDGESDLAVSLRPRHRLHAERLRPHGARAPLIRSCSIGSRPA